MVSTILKKWDNKALLYVNIVYGQGKTLRRKTLHEVLGFPFQMRLAAERRIRK
jgi:hypothetical protein